MLDYQRVPISRNLFFQLVETHSSVSCDHVHTQHFVLTWDTGGGVCVCVCVRACVCVCVCACVCVCVAAQAPDGRNMFLWQKR